MSKIAKALQKAEQAREPNNKISLSNNVQWKKVDNAIADYTQTHIMKTDILHFEKNRLLTDETSLYIRDSFNVLRATILNMTRKKGLNSIMVTSPKRGEGKTTIATNLAMSLSRDVRHTALLVDANLRWPAIAEIMGICRHEEGGLEDYLVEHSELPSILINPGMEKFVVMPACKATAESADLISSPRMQNLVEECKNRYPDRYVIYDCPHILNMPDALVFSTYVDGVILVVEEGKTSQEDICATVDILKDANILGIILNKHSNS